MFEIALSTTAVVVSIVALVFAVFSWRESHRPIVTARISAELSSNDATVLELIVENTGNRPALNIRLHADKNDLEKAFDVPEGDPWRKNSGRVFNGETFVPVLEAGKSVKSPFGVFTSEKSTWVYKSILNVKVTYENLGKRKFQNTFALWLVNNRGFALGYFERPRI